MPGHDHLPRSIFMHAGGETGCVFAIDVGRAGAEALSWARDLLLA